MLSDKGPVVIDWPNAARGDANVDIALTWVLISAGRIPTGWVRAAAMGWGRSLLVGAFLERVDLTMVKPELPEVVEWKARDPHMNDAEVRAMRAMVARSD